MPKIDRIKEEVGWLKLVFGVLVAIDASLIGWLAQHYAATRPVAVAAVLLAIAVVSSVLVRVHQLAYRRIEELEGL